MFAKMIMSLASLSVALVLGRPAEAVSPEKATMVCDTGRQNTADRVERLFTQGVIMPLSSYDDDPFVEDASVECVDATMLARDYDERLILLNNRTSLAEEDFIYRKDKTTGEFKRFAWNPWPLQPKANADGSFRFLDEERFPEFKPERGPNGKIVLRDGLQVWLPNNLHRGNTTAFEAANRVIQAAEEWSGRHISWGNDDQLLIHPHSFVDFNAFYSPSTRWLFFGVVPYRMPGSPIVQMLETATSWEIAAHESGHAVQAALKPNRDWGDSYAIWGESFADQMEMWTSLRDSDRVRELLVQTSGDLSQSNAMSRMVEAFGALVGTGPMRDAVNNSTVSTTSDDVHDRSKVLTGACYQLFLAVYDSLLPYDGEKKRALGQAGAIMGIFLTHTTDFTPENTMTLEDVAKAYLKVDKEFYGGRYRDMLVAEFLRREIFDTDSLNEWLAHEASLPDLRLPSERSELAIERLVQTNLDKLGIGPEFGLTLQSVTRDDRFKLTLVRVQLTQGRDANATPLENHGILIFRANGTLADYQVPLPPTVSTLIPARAVLTQAVQRGLDRHGAPLALVRNSEGQLSAEARVLREEGIEVWMEVFTESHPEGERREVVYPEFLYGANKALLERAGIVLTADDLLNQ